MEILNVNNVNPIDETDLSIILDCEITDESGKNIPLNDISVVVSIFDTTGNFIDQKLIPGNRFKYNWNNAEDLLLYLRDEIIDIDDNEDLNPGRYRLRFSFILDTFNSMDSEENRFIVTEISPDRTEIRLNPLSNDTEFINTFTRIKNYERIDKKLELNETSFVEFYRQYVNSVFSDENLSNILSDDEVIVNGMNFKNYLTSVYNERTSTSDSSEAIEKATNAIEEMKVLLKSKKGDALIFVSKHFENIKNDLFNRIRNTPVDDDTKRSNIISEFKIGIKNKTEEFLNNSITEVVNMVLKN